jgi:hypothetical protein
MATSHAWQFAARFRRNAFGWQSDTPVQRLKEALAEIKAVAKKEPIVAAEGAVLLLEKLEPAIAQVDSSSGRMGSAVNRAIELLVPIIAQAGAGPAVHGAWLNRLWQALESGDTGYLDYLRERWGELCASKAVASAWADRLLPAVTAMFDLQANGTDYDYFEGTPACFSALYSAGRHDDLFALIAKSEYRGTFWPYRIWGARALAAAGKPAEAVRYAEEANDGWGAPVEAIAAYCEGVLLEAGFADEAYARYGVKVASATTNLAAFKAVVKKYPQIPREAILRDLVASQPGLEGKWFAAAKDAGFYELAIALANQSASDPRTLMRAARDFVDKLPEFALAAGMTALRGIANGWGYEITGADVLDAYAAVRAAAATAGMTEAAIKADIRSLIDEGGNRGKFVGQVLKQELHG